MHYGRLNMRTIPLWFFFTAAGLLWCRTTTTAQPQLAPAPESRQEWTVAPSWVPGQELVFRGKIAEQSQGQGVQFSKDYRLEVRVLVLDSREDWNDLACCTKLQASNQRQLTEVTSLRLAVVTVNGLNKLRPGMDSQLPARPLDGPQPWEAGFLLELPAARIKSGQKWTLTNPNHPSRYAQVRGPAAIGGIPCVLVEVHQQSDDWDQPRADRTAWRMTERIWIGLRQGFVQRFERLVERRAPAHREVTHRITTEYDLESQLRYDGLFFDDRRRDIQLTLQIEEQLRPLLRDPGRPNSTAAFEALVAKIDAAGRLHPATPYREVLLRLRHQAVAGSQHRLPPPVSGETGNTRTGLIVGQAAPDFATQELEGGRTFTLRACRGKSVLLAFFNPASLSTPELLRFLQQQQEQHGPNAVLAALSLSDQSESLLQLRTQLRLTVPLLAGRSLRWSYGVEATPHFVLVDSAGAVRAVHTGWGPETAQRLEQLLRSGRP